MPRATVTERLRRTIRKLMEAEGHGAAARLAEFSEKRPGGMKIRQQDLSYFKHDTEGRENPITLDKLDDIADYFRVSIGELFEVKKSDLSGDEQRLVLAFRALHELTREHFLALLEAASVSANATLFQRRRFTKHLKGKRGSAKNISPLIYERRLRPTTEEAATELSDLRAFLDRVIVALGAAAAGAIPDRPLPGLGPQETEDGGMAP